MPPEPWHLLDMDAKVKLAEHWCHWLCDAWHLPRARFEVRDFEDDGQRGAFEADDWSVAIARRLLADAPSVVAVIAHEVRHARQAEFLRLGQHPLGAAGLAALASADSEYDSERFLNQYESELEWDAEEAERYVRAGYSD